MKMSDFFDKLKENINPDDLKVSYNYGWLMQEITEDIDAGFLKPEDKIVIFRGEPIKAKAFGVEAKPYAPIEDWDYVENYHTEDDEVLENIEIRSVAEVLTEAVEMDKII
jgi:hypothetical protein